MSDEPKYTHCGAAISHHARCGVGGEQCQQCSRIDVLRAESATLRAQLSEAQARLAEIERQEPVDREAVLAKAEELIGVGAGAWDTVNSLEIVGAILESAGVRHDAAPVSPAAQATIPFSLPDAAIERVYDNARRMFRNHMSSVRGQQITQADGYEYHIINATLDELRASIGRYVSVPPAQQAVAVPEIFHGTTEALNKLSVLPSKDQP